MSWVQGVAAAKHTHSRPALAVMGSSGFFLSRPCLASLSSSAGHTALSLFLLRQELYL